MQNFNEVNNQAPGAKHYWVVQPYPYVIRPMQQSPPAPYPQYPPMVYPTPYNPQINQPIRPQYMPGYVPPPTPVAKTPKNKPSTKLPPAPIGRTPSEVSVNHPKPTVAYPPMVPVPVQQPLVRPVPVLYNQPPPVPQYYYPAAPLAPYPSYEKPNPPTFPPRDSRPNHNHSNSNEPPIMSYFGRRYEMDPYQNHNRWYQ